jgi:hypothetical protein
MSLLPEVERELLRVAGAPVSRRRSAGATGALATAALTVVALVVGAVFVLTLHARTAGSASAPSPAPATSGSNPFPGAPRTQRGDWAGSGACPFAARNRYLPSRSGCVTAFYADVAGDGHLDLVLLYARLGKRPVFDSMYPALDYTLLVVLPTGRQASTQIRHLVVSPPVMSVIRYGEVRRSPGAALFVQVGRISSGSFVEAYTLRADRLTNAGPTLSYGGDSATQTGFACERGAIIQHQFELEGPLPRGPWKRTDITYAWHAQRLRRVRTQSSTFHGALPARLTTPGLGCGTIVNSPLTADWPQSWKAG